MEITTPYDLKRGLAVDIMTKNGRRYLGTVAGVPDGRRCMILITNYDGTPGGGVDWDDIATIVRG